MANVGGKLIPVAAGHQRKGRKSPPIDGYKAAVNLGARLSKPAGWPVGEGFGYRVLAVFVRKRPGRLGKRAPAGVPCATLPDADNYLKAVMDAVKGVLWKDDGQVYDVRGVKMYAGPGRPPGTVVVVEAVKVAETSPVDVAAVVEDFHAGG